MTTRTRGFTLIELLVVVAIIGLLASIIVVSLNTSRTKSKNAANQQLDANFNHNLGDALIGQWTFDNGDATDSSGSEKNGTIVGAPTFSNITPFGVGQSIGLNGTVDRVTLPAMFPSSGVCNLTISAWSYNTGMPGTGLMGGVVAGNSGGNYANIEYHDSNLRFELRSVTTPSSGLVSGDYKNKWVHTILTLQNGQPRGYINGVLAWTGTNVGCVGLTSWQVGNWDRYFSGYIDSVRIYDRALETAEVQKLFAEEAPKHEVAMK